MTAGVTELQAGSSGGYCVFNVWTINTATYRYLQLSLLLHSL